MNNSPVNFTDPSGHGALGPIMNIHRAGGSCSGAGADNAKYCNLPNGGYIDAQHFYDGVLAWQQVHGAWSPGQNFQVDITGQAGYKDFHLTFSSGPIASEAELQRIFIRWYAKVYQPAYEGNQWDKGDHMSAFHTEDIPSAVLGAYMASKNPGVEYMKSDGTSWEPRPKARILFTDSMNAMGGTDGGGGGFLNLGPHGYFWDASPIDCRAYACGADVAQNTSGFLKLYTGSYYTNIPWTGANLDPLNIILSGYIPHQGGK